LTKLSQNSSERPLYLMKHALYSNGLMEIVRPLNRSWTYDTYFSLYRAIHPEEKVRGELSGYHKNTIQFN